MLILIHIAIKILIYNFVCVFFDNNLNKKHENKKNKRQKKGEKEKAKREKHEKHVNNYIFCFSLFPIFHVRIFIIIIVKIFCFDGMLGKGARRKPWNSENLSKPRNLILIFLLCLCFFSRSSFCRCFLL